VIVAKASRCQVTIFGKYFMTLDDHTQPMTYLPQSMHLGLSLLPDTRPIILLTRHSIRVLVDEQGYAGYKLPLTELGRQLASEWGDYFCAQTGRQFRACLTSPIGRCVDTASLMLEGRSTILAEQPEVVKTALLVEPGSFVQDHAVAQPIFMQKGALIFINMLLSQQLAGVKHPMLGVFDILKLLHTYLPDDDNGVLLAVSHDTILAVFLAVMHDETEVNSEDWPDMMEGIFLWFEGDCFEESQVHWIWRGVAHSRAVSSFVA
jgi:Histidine phosphatase superfamily (branch 1)